MKPEEIEQIKKQTLIDFWNKYEVWQLFEGDDSNNEKAASTDFLRDWLIDDFLDGGDDESTSAEEE